MTEKMRGEVSPDSVWGALVSRNALTWVMREELEGTTGLVRWNQQFQELLENSYVRFHQLALKIADVEVPQPNLEAIEITAGAIPTMDDRGLISEDYVRRLTDANESLRAQYEANKTQLADEQRTTDGYVSQLKEAREQLHEAREQRDTLLYTFKEMKQSNEQLTELLEDKKTGQLLMFQTLYGAVRESFGDSVVIAFETDDDIIEHTYERQQFLEGKLPDEEERVKVCFYLSYTGEVQGPVLEGTMETEDDLIDLRVHRKNLVEGSDTF